LQPLLKFLLPVCFHDFFGDHFHAVLHQAKALGEVLLPHLFEHFDYFWVYTHAVLEDLEKQFQHAIGHQGQQV
jgi:hypothetical protein